MGNKEDWEELEKWAKNQENKRVKDYGVDISNVDWNKRAKKMGIVAKFIGSIYKLIVFVSLSIAFLLIAAILLWAYSNFDNFRRNFDAGNVKKNIEQMYDVKLETISEETDERGNGKYTFALKKNKNITFTAFKDGARSSNDFLENCHKYFFDKWDNEYKSSFVINEEFSNGLLKYSMYTEIEGYKDIDIAMKKVDSFVKYCKDYFYPMWSIYLKNNNIRIQLYNSLDTSFDKVTSDAKKDYLNYLIYHKLEEDIPIEEFDKYLGKNQ